MVRTSSIRNIIIPDEDKVLECFLQRKQNLTPRDQRDFPRLLRLIKGVALLNWSHREMVDPSTIKANSDDVEEGFKLYESCAKSNELGLSPETYEVYEKVIKPLLDRTPGLDKKDIMAAHLRVNHRPLPFRRLRDELLPSLEAAGLIVQEPDPNDKRRMLVYPTVARDVSEEPKPQGPGGLKYVPRNSGVSSAQLQKLPLGDLLPKLREIRHFQNPSSFLYLVKTMGLRSDQEASEILARLKEEGSLVENGDESLDWGTG